MLDVFSVDPWVTLQQLPESPRWWALGLVFTLGASIGSFCCCVAGRFLADESITSPPSHCDHCKRPLEWFENIPVLSWPLLLGKCRTCHTAIPISAWLTEIVTGLLFVAAAWQVGIGWVTLFWWFLLGNLVVIFLTDLREHLIFQINSLSLIPAGVLMHLLGLGILAKFSLYPADFPLFTLPLQLGNSPLDVVIPYHMASSIMGILLAWVFFEGAILLSRKLLGTDGFGHGDTHLMMGVGAYFGWEATAASLLLGFVLQAVLAMPMLVMGWLRRQQWVILLAGAGSLGFAVLPYLGAPWAAQFGLDRMTLLLIGLFGSVVSLLVFLRQLRQQESFVYVPLGPALILATVSVMTWSLLS